MHLHILGICGTFMGGIAAIARQAGHKVTGCDANVYPPMSTQLEAQGIELIEGFSPDQISLKPDLFIIGNVVSRGNPLMEAILDQGLPYQGTHGKTTTTAMLTWILQANGLEPGYLIGGVPNNFDVSARLGQKTGPNTNDPHYFVIEADEYDTAFFDKRSKFVHYRPRTAILNNLEFDHADIFADITAIETQFHHLVRTVPSNGCLVVNGAEESLERVIKRGCWSTLQKFGLNHKQSDWSLEDTAHEGFKVLFQSKEVAEVVWDQDASVTGRHNQLNALAAIAEPRSNTMKLGVMKSQLPDSLREADLIFGYGAAQGKDALGWDLAGSLAPLGAKAQAFDQIDALVLAVLKEARAGDHILVMSNGGFGGIHQQLLDALA